MSLQVKCWQIRKQSKAPQAAGAIHTDFERGFICAEVYTYWFNSCALSGLMDQVPIQKNWENYCLFSLLWVSESSCVGVSDWSISCFSGILWTLLTFGRQGIKLEKCLGVIAFIGKLMTYFFVFQVMKFDDLKELGSEGAVKVRK